MFLNRAATVRFQFRMSIVPSRIMQVAGIRSTRGMRIFTRFNTYLVKGRGMITLCSVEKDVSWPVDPEATRRAVGSPAPLAFCQRSWSRRSEIIDPRAWMAVSHVRPDRRLHSSWNRRLRAGDHLAGLERPSHRGHAVVSRMPRGPLQPRDQDLSGMWILLTG